MFVSLIVKGIVVLALFSAALAVILCMASGKIEEEMRSRDKNA